MLIYIYDCDFLCNPNDFYNEKGMRLASYYKQKGDRVVLIDNSINIAALRPDELIIIKEKKKSALPPLFILNYENTVAYGKEMKMFITIYKEFPSSINKVRPDYLFYNDDVLQRNWRQKTEYKRLENDLEQNYHNSFLGKKCTLIVDENLWDLSEEEICKRLLKINKNDYVAFLYPVKLKPIIKSKKIQEILNEMQFYKKTVNVFLNNYGITIECLKDIINFIKNFKSHNYFKPIKIPTIMLDHKIEGNGFKDFYRDIVVMEYAKTNQVQVNFTCPSFKITPFWFYFNDFKIWSNQHRKDSYIEYMSNFSPIEKNQLFSNSLYWHGGKLRCLLYLIKYHPEIANFIHTKWGNQKDEIEINYNYIKKEFL